MQKSIVHTSRSPFKPSGLLNLDLLGIKVLSDMPSSLSWDLILLCYVLVLSVRGSHAYSQTSKDVWGQIVLSSFFAHLIFLQNLNSIIIHCTRVWEDIVSKRGGENENNREDRRERGVDNKKEGEI